MSTRSSKRVCFSPDINDEKPTLFLKHGRVLGNRKKIIGSWSFRVAKDPRLSPVRFLLRLGAKVARATIRVVSMRSRSRSSRKVSSSSSSSSTLVRSRSVSDHTDSHRAEAVEDCIEFLHSSSSRERPPS